MTLGMPQAALSADGKELLSLQEFQLGSINCVRAGIRGKYYQRMPHNKWRMGPRPVDFGHINNDGISEMRDPHHLVQELQIIYIHLLLPLKD